MFLILYIYFYNYPIFAVFLDRATLVAFFAIRVMYLVMDCNSTNFRVMFCGIIQKKVNNSTEVRVMLCGAVRAVIRPV